MSEYLLVFMSEYLLVPVFVKLYLLDFQSVCVLFAVCVLCVYHQDYISEPHRAFVSCSSKSSCLDLSIHTTLNAITP